MIKKAAVVTALSLLLTSSVWAQSGKQVKFDPEKPLGYIKVLADDSLSGRKSGLQGDAQAAQYVAGKLKEWGIEPAGDGGTYFQKFSIVDLFNVEPGAVLEVTAGKKTRKLTADNELFDEWSICRLSGSADVKAEMVFAGYGIHSPEKGYDDYAGIDVKGKIVLIVDGMPDGMEGVNPSTDLKIAAAREQGAVALILATPPSPYGEEMVYPASCRIAKENYRPDFAVAGINQATLAFIFADLKYDEREILKTINGTHKPQSFTTGVTARLKVKTGFWPEKGTANVLGKISGTDPRLKNEFIILGAHMDHLGFTPDGEICNGADDNASGTAVVMEVARLMKENRVRPKRTIVFALWAGEEQGLLGSTHYVNNPLFPLDRTAVNINLDMVGQGKDTISVGGVYFCQAVWSVLEKELPKEAMEGISTRRGLGGSDCLSFMNKGVPAFHIIGNETHIKTHGPRDEWDLIMPEMLLRAERFVYYASKTLGETGQNIFYPEFRALTLFKNNEIINYAAVPLGTAIDKYKGLVNPDVDWQLVYPEITRTGTPAADRESLSAALAALPKTVESAGGLTVFGVRTNKVQSRTARGENLILGLDDPSLVKDNPAWLAQASKSGLKYVRVRTADLALEGASLSKGALDMVQGIQKAGCLIIADGVEGPVRTALLQAAKKPLLLVTDGLPSGEDLKLVKEGRHIVGLVFAASRSPELYFGDLKKARDIVGVRQLLIWNDRNLWEPASSASVVHLLELMRQGSWAEPESSHGEGSPLGRVLSGNLLGLLRGSGND